MPIGDDYAAWAERVKQQIPAVPGYGPTLIAVHGPLGQALYVSPEAIAVAGVPASTLMGDAGVERIVAGDLPVVVEAYADGIESRDPIALVCRHTADNGEQWWVRTHFQALQDPAMERLVFVAMSRQASEPAQGAHFWSLAEGPRPAPTTQGSKPAGTAAQTPSAKATTARESLHERPRRGP